MRRTGAFALQGPMRTFTIALITIFPLAVSADPKPTTQACLGTFDQFLTCPAGARRAGTECRAQSQHWSGSSRQGPALFLRSDGKTVSFAASYKDHKKTGRVYRFDDHGRLESWADVVDDQDHGLSVTCLPDGRVWYLAYYDHGKVSGISRSWRASDGAFVAAVGHDAAGHAQRVDVSPQEQVRPDALCRPARCDVGAKPDTSGLGK